MNTRKNVLRAWTISVIETLEDGISPYSPIKKKYPKQDSQHKSKPIHLYKAKNTTFHTKK